MTNCPASAATPISWKTEQRKVSDLIPFSKNPRKISAAQTDHLKNSLRKFGLAEIPVIDTDNTIVAGHQRLKILQLIGRGNEVIDVRIPNRQLTEAERAEYNIQSNILRGEWDSEMLAAFDKDMLEAIGVEDMDMSAIFADEQPIDACEHFDIDAAVESIPEPKTKPGDIYQLGMHRLMCGDTVKLDDVQRLMSGAAAEMIFTDPPYNVDYEGKTGKKLKIANDAFPSHEAFEAFLTAVATNYAAVARPGAAIYICHSDMERPAFTSAFEKAGFELRQIIIWCKDQFVLSRQDYHWQHEPILYGWRTGAGHYYAGGRAQSTLWDIPKPAASRIHPTMKPTELIIRALSNSAKADDVVLDLFGGSGSTLIACERASRTCYTMEIDPRYCDAIIARWEAFTGDKAVKL